MSMTSAEETKAVVLDAFDTPFNRRDYAKAAAFWSENCIQHSAHIAPGRDGLFNLIRSLPATLRYENARIMVDGDYVMLHGRFSGHGRPRSRIAADIVRMEGGRLAEHWDVLQDEATKEESRSAVPMFGTSFAEPHQQPAAGAAGAPLTVEDARTIVAPLYDALNQPAKKDVAALLAKAASPYYRSFHTNDDWLTRDQLAEVFTMIGAAVPDLRWTIEDIQTFGDQVVVRGRATGTPTGEQWGAKPTRRSGRPSSPRSTSTSGTSATRWSRACASNSNEDRRRLRPRRLPAQAGELVLGPRVVGPALAHELVQAYLGARFSNEERHVRRLDKVKAIEERYR